MRRAALPSREEAAMPTDEAALADLRRATARRLAEIRRRLAAPLSLVCVDQR
jgi:hypothetical protein